MACEPCEGNALLEKAYKRTADLEDDVRRLADELTNKNSMPHSFKTRLPRLSSFFLAEQSGQLASQNTHQETLLWDPSS